MKNTQNTYVASLLGWDGLDEGDEMVSFEEISCNQCGCYPCHCDTRQEQNMLTFDQRHSLRQLRAQYNREADIIQSFIIDAIMLHHWDNLHSLQMQQNEKLFRALGVLDAEIALQKVFAK